MPPKTTCLFVDEESYVSRHATLIGRRVYRDDFNETNENYASALYGIKLCSLILIKLGSTWNLGEVSIGLSSLWINNRNGWYNVRKENDDWLYQTCNRPAPWSELRTDEQLNGSISNNTVNGRYRLLATSILYHTLLNTLDTNFIFPAPQASLEQLPIISIIFRNETVNGCSHRLAIAEATTLSKSTDVKPGLQPLDISALISHLLLCVFSLAFRQAP